MLCVTKCRAAHLTYRRTHNADKSPRSASFFSPLGSGANFSKRGSPLCLLLEGGETRFESRGFSSLQTTRLFQHDLGLRPKNPIFSGDEYSSLHLKDITAIRFFVLLFFFRFIDLKPSPQCGDYFQLNFRREPMLKYSLRENLLTPEPDDCMGSQPAVAYRVCRMANSRGYPCEFLPGMTRRGTTLTVASGS